MKRINHNDIRLRIRIVLFHPNDGEVERTILHEKKMFIMYARRIPALRKTAATRDMSALVGWVAQIIRNIQATILDIANPKHIPKDRYQLNAYEARCTTYH